MAGTDVLDDIALADITAWIRMNIWNDTILREDVKKLRIDIRNICELDA